MVAKLKSTDGLTIKLSKPTDDVVRSVVFEGVTDVMFDRYPGDNNTKLEPWQKFYFDPALDRVIVCPALNIMSFLSAHNTNSAPKRLRDARVYKKFCNACLSFVMINPQNVPFLRDGKPIRIGKFDNGVDAESGAYIHHSVARLDKGIPNPKTRPVLPLPWELKFTLTISSNREIKEQDILNIFEEGGRAIGIGTFRGLYGKFRIAEWA